MMPPFIPRDELLLHPSRLSVAVALYVLGPMRMKQLKEVTGLSWGSLERAVDRLRSEGVVAVEYVPSRDGVGVRVSLTEEGRARLERLLEALSSIAGPRGPEESYEAGEG